MDSHGCAVIIPIQVNEKIFPLSPIISRIVPSLPASLPKEAARKKNLEFEHDGLDNRSQVHEFSIGKDP